MRDIRVRSGRGLGDSLYLQSIVRHLINKQKNPIIALTDYPEIFSQLDCKTEPFTRENVDILAHYALRKRLTGTTQFEDCCIQAGIKEKVELKIDWERKNTRLLDRVFQYHPFIVVQMPREPMNRKDGFGMQLLPDFRVVQAIIDKIKMTHNIVQMGMGKRLYQYEGIDIDLTGETSVSDLLDLASVSDGFVGHCSFMNPLAESFNKPSLTVLSKKGLHSGVDYIRQITPEKILHKKNSYHVIDTDPIEKCLGAVNDFLKQKPFV